VIGNPRNNQSLFSNEDLWKPFYNDHISIKQKLTEKKFQIVKTENPEMSNEQIFGNIDNHYKEKLQSDLVNNLDESEILHKELKILKNVKQELNKTLKYILNLNVVNISDSDKDDVRDLLNKISIDSKGKANQI